MIEIASMNNDWGSQAALAGFYSPPSVVAGNSFASLLISIFVLVLFTIFALFIGQSSLKRKELN